METLLKSIGVFVLVFALVTVLGLIFAYPIMWLLNYIFSATLLTYVFGAPVVTYWKAYALNLLAGLLLPRNTNTSSK